MAVTELLDMQGAKVGEVEIKDEIFNCEVKAHLIHDVVKMQLANRRSGTRPDKDKEGRKRRRAKTVTTERNGPGETREFTVTSHGWRRYSIRAAAERLQLHPSQKGAPGGFKISPYNTLHRFKYESS